MAKTPIQTRELKDSLDVVGSKTASQDQADAPLISVPNTQIAGRAPIRDLSKIPSPKMGIERIQVNDIILVDNETSSEKEVKKDSHDHLDRIRFVGDWKTIKGNLGNYASGGSDSTDFIEVTFYGTGLNILSYGDETRSVAVSIDGGAEGSEIIPAGTSSVLNGRNYSPNIVFPAASGLSKDLHTAKIRQTTGSGGSPLIYGFEILNESTTIDVPVNSALLVGEERHEMPATSLGYALASDFDSASDDPTTDGKGGAVVVYSEKQADGSIEVKQRLNTTDSSQLDLSAADHSNEEVIKRVNWREFGSGRNDDFSTLAGVTADRAFTLDDGTTTLVANDVFVIAKPYLGLPSNVSWMTITFVGTGLDFVRADNAPGGSDTYEAFVNGASVGNLESVGVTSEVVTKVVSGLPYGTHTVKIARQAAVTYALQVSDFIIYGPKKPSIPEGAAKLGSYFLMGDFVAQLTSDVVGLDVSSGVLRKSPTREMTYSGTWSITGPNLPYWSGFQLLNNVNADYFEYTFFGTGCIHKYTYSSPPIVEIRLDGALLGSTGTVTVINGTYNPGTSRITETNAPNFQLEGLPLGLHTIRLSKTAGTNYQPVYLDIITPIHSYEASAELLHDRLIGSNSITTETGLSDFHKGKQSFPQGVDLGASKTKWQEKILAANVISDGDFLFFNNLTIGKTYKLYAQIYFRDDAGTGVDCDVNHNGIQIAGTGWNPAAAGVAILKASVSVVFTAVATSVSLDASSASANEYIAGNGTKDHTWAVLEELPNHIETDEW